MFHCFLAKYIASKSSLVLFAEPCCVHLVQVQISFCIISVLFSLCSFCQTDEGIVAWRSWCHVFFTYETVKCVLEIFPVCFFEVEKSPDWYFSGLNYWSRADANGSVLHVWDWRVHILCVVVAWIISDDD